MSKKKVSIELKLEIDTDEWAAAYGVSEWTATDDAKEHLARIAADAIKQHDMARVVVVNGRMEPTI